MYETFTSIMHTVGLFLILQAVLEALAQRKDNS